MIQAHEDVIWVKTDTGELTVFVADRLIASICRGAGAAAEEVTGIAQAIAAAVIQHARENLAVGELTTGRIAEMAETLLEMLGYPEWAKWYGGGEVSGEIALDELATRAAAGFELGFYQELDQALAGVGRRGLARVQMRGLRACVLRLRGTQRWGRNCRRLADEIMDHVWARVVRLPRDNGAALQLAVLE